VIVGVSGYSRLIVARMIPSRQTADVLSGHKWCLCRLGSVPRKGVYDNEGAIGRNRGGRMEFTREFLAFKGALGMGAVILKGGFPEGKGVVERANRYLETSFLPGRSFSDPDDFNAQLWGWLDRANTRIHRAIRCRPIDRLNEDLAAMMALPPVLPDTTHRFSIRLGRDHYVRFDTCDYSVHPKGDWTPHRRRRRSRMGRGNPFRRRGSAPQKKPLSPSHDHRGRPRPRSTGAQRASQRGSTSA
jgi:hypothetical protein